MWTTWGPGVCQQALFTLTSFQALFGVVPICSPPRPESNAHHVGCSGEGFCQCAPQRSVPPWHWAAAWRSWTYLLGPQESWCQGLPLILVGGGLQVLQGWKYNELTTVLGGFTRVARSSCWSQPTCSTIRSLQQPQLCRAIAHLSWSLTHFLSTSARLILALFNTMNYGRCSFCCGMAMNGMGTDIPHPPRWWPKACMGRRSLCLTRPSAELAGHGTDLHSHLNPKSHLAWVEAGLSLAQTALPAMLRAVTSRQRSQHKGFLRGA